MKLRCGMFGCLLGLVLTALATAQGADAAAPTSGTAVVLFNGADLSNWEEIKHNPEQTTGSLWIVDAGGVLRCTGAGSGYLRTREVYENYTLNLEWRWPEKPGNSGVMLHVQPPDKIWPEGFEAQLFQRRAGDILLFGTATCAEKQPDDDEHMSSNHIPFKAPGSEGPRGQWNSYKITCHGDTIEVRVNGTLQNTLTQCRPARGMIALKAEASPIELRNITLEKLKP